VKVTHLVIAMFLLFQAVPAVSADWVPLNGDEFYYYDSSRVTVDKSGITHVWVKNTYSEKDLKKAIAIDTSKDYSEYMYTIVHQQIDCKSQTLGAEGVYDYAKDGSIIDSVYGGVKLYPIVPESYGERLVTTVCKAVPKKKKR
jgi:hypothetical protein